MNTQDIAGILVTLIGAWLFYRSRKRVFGRRNAFGQEVFDSYRHKLSARVIDLILGFFATVVMLTGIIFLAMERGGPAQLDRNTVFLSEPSAS